MSASIQNQALCAVIFLYRHVLRRDLDDMEFVRAKRQKNCPWFYPAAKSTPFSSTWMGRSG